MQLYGKLKLMYSRHGHATRRKWLKVVKLNIYCFHTFKHISEC